MLEAAHKALVKEFAEVSVLDAAISLFNQLHHKGRVASLGAQTFPKEDAQDPFEVSYCHHSSVSHVIH